MTDQATLELWTGLARVLVDQAHVTDDREEKQLATELAAMALDFVGKRSDQTLRELVDMR